MASVFKRKGASRYTIEWKDESGVTHRKAGTADKGVTERIARDIENKVALRREGIIDARDEAYARYASQSLLEHIDVWKQAIESRGATPQHIKLHSSRAMRVVALIKGVKLEDIEAKKPATREGIAQAEADLRKAVESARLSDLTSDGVQAALARLRKEGRSNQTANHHRNAIRSFGKWLYDAHRVRDIILRGVTGFNVKEDPRHDRRTIDLNELRELVKAARTGKPFRSMTGPMRSLCYRLAVASGLRYAEMGSITPESFDWNASPATVTIKAAYAKNGATAALALPDDLATDLKAYVATIEPGTPIFPLPHDKGAAMVRVDLKAAGIPYRDAAGRVFDFHSLRCELATLADAAGVSPRVVQKMMRHSKLEMTGRYTRPRAMDIDAASSMIPSLEPIETEAEALDATGTDGRGVQSLISDQDTDKGNAYASNSNPFKVLGESGEGTLIRWSRVRVPPRSLEKTQDIARQQETKTPGKQGFSPSCTQDHSSQSASQQETPKDIESHPRTANSLYIGDPRLKAIVDAWEHLPEAIRNGMAAMVKASEGR